MRMRPLVPCVQLVLVCLFTVINSSIGTILVYRRQGGEISKEPVYGININNRAIVRHEFQDDDVVYLITSSPSDSCLAKLRRPPEFFEDRLPAKFVLLIDDERCDQGLHVKLQNARQKGYDGVIVYPASIHDERTRVYLAKIPDQIADTIEFNVDFTGYDHGVRLKKYEFQRFSTTRYLLRFTEALYVHETVQSKSESKPSSRFNVLMLYIDAAITDVFYYLVDSSLFDNAGIFLLLVVVIHMIGLLFSWLWRHTGLAARAQPASAVPGFDSRNRFYPVGAASSVSELEAAAREEILRRFIDNLVAQAQTQQVQEHSRIPGQPLTLEEVDQLAAMPVTTVTEDNCPMCQENFALGEITIIPNCNHACHKACLIPWLTKRSRRCPVCRQTIEPD